MRHVWLSTAERYVGIKEMPGPKTHPEIGRWLHRLKAWWTDDETPWCGVFVAAVMQECGLDYPKAYYRARAWATWGEHLPKPVSGCIIVFERGGGGHVAICKGVDEMGRYICVGGNQGNAVSVAAFYPYRAIAFRWPSEPWAMVQYTEQLPLLASNAPVSTGEA